MTDPMRHAHDININYARWQREIMGITDKEYAAWYAHRDNSLKRGIPFRFTLFEWSNWWRRERKRLGINAQRGNRRGQFMMCRYGDLGAYEEGNVYAGTPKDNQNEPHLRKSRSEAMKAKHAANPQACWLRGRTGASHPCSRAVIAPDGTQYGSASEAARARGMCPSVVQRYARWRTHGWCYARRAP